MREECIPTFCIFVFCILCYSLKPYTCLEDYKGGSYIKQHALDFIYSLTQQGDLCLQLIVTCAYSCRIKEGSEV